MHTSPKFATVRGHHKGSKVLIEGVRAFASRRYTFCSLIGGRCCRADTSAGDGI